MKRAIFIALAFLAFGSCSKKVQKAELKYTAEEFTALAHEASSSPEKGEDGIKFSDYSPGVNKLESKALMYKDLPFFAVEFESEEQARNEALRLNQYYSRNWLFDRVEGEPVLEDYVIETFKATNPQRKVKRVPRKLPDQSHLGEEAAPHH
ncbi:MAG: hypothetical protein ACXVCE_04025 [Bacteriovorax sp.]